MNRRQAISFVSLAGACGIMGFIDPTEQKRFPEKFTKNNTGSNLKTMGILGGFGPQATMDFEERLHKVAQQHIPADHNSGYPTMIVHYHRHAPLLLKEDFSPVFPIQPDPRLLASAKKMGAMVDFLLIPSNGVHMMQKEIEASAGCKVLSMIDTTLDEVKKRKWSKVGVMSYANNFVYTQPLKEMGIAFEIIDEHLQQKLDQSIMKVMEGQENENDRSSALAAIAFLRAKKVDGIIPGCTEIPLLLRENMLADDIINPAQLLAEAAIRYSISDSDC